MLLRNVNTGGLMLYDIANNQITGTFFLGNVGLDWQYAAIAPVHGAGMSDLVLRNVNSGAFQVYNIAGNTLVGSASLGAAGLDWQPGGFAATLPSMWLIARTWLKRGSREEPRGMGHGNPKDR